MDIKKIELGRINISTYKVGKKTFYVASRPDRYYNDNAEKFITSDAFLSVTDRYVPHPKDAVSQWLPWRESEAISYDLIFAALYTLRRWYQNQNLESIYIHCDAGTHRSPSVFGLYLLTFHKEIAESIVTNNLRIDGKDDPVSNPIEYAKFKIEKNPGIAVLLEYIRENFSLKPNQTSLEEILKGLNI